MELDGGGRERVTSQQTFHCSKNGRSYGTNGLDVDGTKNKRRLIC